MTVEINYFVADNVYDQKTINDNHILYVPMKLEATNGMIFDQINHDKICRLMDVTVTETLPTEIEGLVIPVVTSAPVVQTGEDSYSFVVTTSDNEVSNAQVVEAGEMAKDSSPPVAEIFDIKFDISSFKKKLRNYYGANINVVFHNGDGHQYDPIEDGDFHVWIYASPKKPVHNKNWNEDKESISLYFKRTSFKPSGKYLIAYTEEDDSEIAYPVAERIGTHNLYVLVDLTISHIKKHSEHHEHTFIKRILNEVFNVPVSDAERELIISGSFDKFLEFSSKLSKDSIKNYKKNISDLTNSIASTRRELVNFLAQKKHNEHMLELLTVNGKEDHTKLITGELSRISQLKKVKSLSFDGSTFIVYTHPLKCVDENSGVEHEIGEMKFIIDFVYGSIRFRNLTRTVFGRNAPHVDEGGTACYGNFVETLPDLFTSMEYAVLVEMAIKFIETANPDDGWGEEVLFWPLAHPEDKDKYLKYHFTNDNTNFDEYCMCSSCRKTHARRLDLQNEDESVDSFYIIKTHMKAKKIRLKICDGGDR